MKGKKRKRLIFLFLTVVMGALIVRLVLGFDWMMKVGSVFFPDLTLKHKIESDYPKIRDERVEDWERVNLMRWWVSENVPWGSSSLELSGEVFDMGVGRFFWFLEKQDKGGLSCYGYATGLAKLYVSYGYNAYTYHHGDADGFNHVITLVEIEYGGKNKLIVEDPMYDVVYVEKKNGEPYDFFELLEELRISGWENIKLRSGEAGEHKVYCLVEDDCEVPEDVELESVNGGVQIYEDKFGTYNLNKYPFVLLEQRFVYDFQEKRKSEEFAKRIEEILE